MSPTDASHPETTTDCPKTDSPTQPYSATAITVTSSVIMVGTMFQGIIVRTNIAEAATPKITAN